ncbi:MAG: helix-turn-helix domain-containing protein [Nanoarchaeota archaeon]|nr:helix-turn-helix domain-containing protein [Nanoarchaeota archaeon]
MEISYLKKAGLTEGESKTYSALSSIGASTIGDIINDSGVSSSKIYQILEKLIKKGLVSMIVEGGKKVFTALPPSMLLDYLDDEKTIIEINKQKVSKILPILESRQGSKTKLPIAEYVKGEKGFLSFRKKLLELAKERDTFYAIVGSRISFKLQKHWFPNSLKLSEKHITQKTVYDNYAWYKKDKSVHRRSERKDYFPIVLDKKYVNLPNISIIGENMQMTDTDENGDIYSFFVHSKNLTDSFVKLMQVVRDTGKVPEGFRKVPDE